MWTKSFHRWMLAMVTQWKGIDNGYANSVASLLISTEQGWGKSTFARTLMPNELRRYFTESFDLNAASSASRQPLLKNLMQMNALNIRRAYRQQAEPLRRIASFIGISNRRFYVQSPMEEVLRSCFTFCNEKEEGARLLSSADIYRELRRFNATAMRGTTCAQLSRLLPVIGRRVHTRYGNGYWVRLIEN